MMKYTSKKAFLLGLPVLVGTIFLCSVNVVSSEIRINPPSVHDIHRAHLHTLFLGNTENQDSMIQVKDNGAGRRFNILNGLIMGENSGVDSGATLVTIGGGTNNQIGDVSKSGIGGGDGNYIITSYSVIGGGKGNTIEGDKDNAEHLGAIAGGHTNEVSSGGSIAGGSNNRAENGGVVIGGLSNIAKLNGLALGHSSNGGNNTFSWNSPSTPDNSAVIVANGGVLIGTNEPVPGVNLVVQGAMKIGDNTKAGIVGEIRMMDGCFYGYDGHVWHVINKASTGTCPHVTCAFGSTLLQEGDTVQAYTQSYAENCSSVQVNVSCNNDGTLGAGIQYYPYCYQLSGYGILSDELLNRPACGSADGQSYTSAPSSSLLCSKGNASSVSTSDSAYTWTCTKSSITVNCGATRVYNCEGTTPSGAGVSRGASIRGNGYSPTSWTYKNGELGACEWTCGNGYQQNGNGCVLQPSECGSAANQSHISAPTSNLCNAGTPSSVSTSNTQFTWTCVGGSSISCSAMRKYNCEGTPPSGDGVNKGDTTRAYSYTPTSWEYKASGALGACQWQCYNGYQRNGNTCVQQSPSCGSANGGSYTSAPSSSSLCSAGSASSVSTSNTQFTWTCGGTASCSATRKYNCGGTSPSGNGVNMGDTTRTYSYTPASWEYKSSGTLGACQWKCNAGYYKNGNSCASCPGGYTSDAGATSQSSCYKSCEDTTYIAHKKDSYCTSCDIGKYKSSHTVYYDNTSSCSDCTGKPSNSHWTSNGSSSTNCAWACNNGYHESGNTCVKNDNNNGNGNNGNGNNGGTYGGGVGGGCFLAGTPVLTPDGSKNIEDIEKGDLVLSYNIQTQSYEYNEVLAKLVHENNNDDVYTFVIDGKVLEATDLHPFYVVGSAKWPYQCHLQYRLVSAKYLRVGDQLVMSDGTFHTIESISHRSNFGTVYNLNVANVHTYFVGDGYLVHNSATLPGQNKIGTENEAAIGGDQYMNQCGWHNGICCRNGSWDSSLNQCMSVCSTSSCGTQF